MDSALPVSKACYMHLHLNIAQSEHIPYSNSGVHNNDSAASELLKVSWIGRELIHFTFWNSRYSFLLTMTLENSLK